MNRAFRSLCLLIAAVLVAACGSAASSSAGSSSAASSPSKTLLVGNFNEPDSLDPAAGLGGNDYEVLYSIFDRLLTFDPRTGAIRPGLATSWGFGGPQGRTFTLKIRPHVNFQDGTPLDAEAVVESLEYYKGLGIQKDIDSVSSITAPSADTVQLQLTKPYSALPAVLADRAGMIVSPTAVKKYGKDFGRHPVGAGPYQFESWSAGSQIVLSRFKGYWQPSKPKLAGMTYKIYPNATAMVSALISGQIDYVYNVDPQQLNSLKAGSGLVVRAEPSMTYDDITISNAIAPTNNVLVRRAMNMAIDRKKINQTILGGTGSPAYLPVPDTYWAYTKGLDVPKYDPAGARKLLQQAGLGGYVTVQVCYTTAGNGGEQMFGILQSQMKEAGITLQPTVSTGANCNEQLLIKKSLAGYMKGWSGRPDPYLTYFENFGVGALYNAGGAAYPGMDAVMDKIANVDKQAEQKPLYDQLNRLFLDDVPTLPTVFVPDVTAYSNKVGGEVPNFQGKNDLTTLYFK